MKNSYYEKYIKYKNKYNLLKEQLGGHNCPRKGFHQFSGDCGNNSILTILLFSDFGSKGESNLFHDKLMSYNISTTLRIGNPKPLVDDTTPKFLLPLNIDISSEEDLDYCDKMTQRMLQKILLRLKNQFNEIGRQRIILPKIDPRLNPKLDDRKWLSDFAEDTVSRGRTILRGERQMAERSVCTAYGQIMNLKEFINHNNLQEIKYDYEHHGATFIDYMFLANLFNYYLFEHSSKSFINSKNFTENNFYNLNNDITNNNILGIEIVIHKSGTRAHSVCLYRCNSKEYYYDTNGIKNKDDDLEQQIKSIYITMKEYEWIDIFFKYFINNIDNKLQNWKDFINDLIVKLYYPEYDIDNITVLYLDKYESEKDYYDKISYDIVLYDGYYSPIRYLREILNNIKLDNKIYTKRLFYYIFSFDNIDRVHILLEYNGKDINYKYDDDYTILHYMGRAIISYNLFSEILDNVSPTIINSKTRTEGLTLLHLLTIYDYNPSKLESYNEKYINKLIEKGGDISITDNNSNTIFHHASKDLNLSLLIVFVGNSIDKLNFYLSQKNANGKTPLEIFEDNKSTEASEERFNATIRKLLTIK